MPVPDASPESRIDAVFDPARTPAPHDSRMPWQRTGVINEHDSSRWVRPGPYRPRTIVLLAVLATSPLALMAALVRPGWRAPGWWTGPLGLLALLLAILLWGNWLVARARRTGNPYAPGWAWLVAGGLVGLALLLMLAGWLPLQHMWFIAMFGFSWLGSLAMPMSKREGKDLHCAKCEYAYPYTAPDGPPAPALCSECGAEWHAKGGLMRGTKVRPRPARIAIWVALMAGMVATISFRGPMLSVMPTGSLIDMVTAPRQGFVMDEWAALQARTLTPAQHTRLARELLELRLLENTLSKEADAWLGQESLAGRLPPDLNDRYNSEMCEARVLAPATARVGQTVEITLEAIHRGSAFGPREVFLAFQGFERDDKPGLWLGQQNSLIHARLVTPSNPWIASASGAQYAPRADLLFETPGTRTVRCVYWVAILPQFTPSAPVTWIPAGPAPPAGAFWFERREAEVRIDLVGDGR